MKGKNTNVYAASLAHNTHIACSVPAYQADFYWASFFVASCNSLENEYNVRV